MPLRRLSAPRVLLCLLFLGTAVAASAATDDDILVNVQRRGDTIVVDVEAPVTAPSKQAWLVLTDYEHMASFISNLKLSVVVSRAANHLEVRQVGEARKGPLTFAFETVRGVDLVPEREIHSQLISGDFKSYEFTTQIVEQGNRTVILNHGEYVPNRWVPPVIGPAMIAAETRKQYAEIRAEIMRRAAATT